MNNFIRKNDILAMDFDGLYLEAHFRHLDEHPNTEPSKRVEKILDLLNRRLSGTSTREKGQAHMGLLRVLSAYRWTSYVSDTAQGFREIRIPADREKLSKEEKWEYEAVRDLLECVPYLGTPPRIRRCVVCQRWLFAAKRADQKYCKRGNCRQKHYESDATIRESKKLYMRWYRSEEKKREESRKRAVKFRGKRTAEKAVKRPLVRTAKKVTQKSHLNSSY